MQCSSVPDDFERRLRGADVNLDVAKDCDNPFSFGEYVDDLECLAQGTDQKLQGLYPGWEPDHFRQFIDVILQKPEAREMLKQRDERRAEKRTC